MNRIVNNKLQTLKNELYHRKCNNLLSLKRDCCLRNDDRQYQAWRVDSCGLESNTSRILLVVSASVLLRGLPGGLRFWMLPVSSSRFLHFSTVAMVTLKLRLARNYGVTIIIYVIVHAVIVICLCIVNTILTNNVSSALLWRVVVI